MWPGNVWTTFQRSFYVLRSLRKLEGPTSFLIHMSFYCWNRAKPFLPFKISKGKIIISISTFPFRKRAFMVQTCSQEARWGRGKRRGFGVTATIQISAILRHTIFSLSHFSVSEIRLRLKVNGALNPTFFQGALRLLLLVTRGQCQPGTTVDIKSLPEGFF